MKTLLCMWFAASSAAFASSSYTGFDNWLVSQTQISTKNLLLNISPEGASLGSVVASPSKEAPNYFKHWVRDAALTMDVVISLYQRAKSIDEKNLYYKHLMDYVDFSRSNQLTANLSQGLGEPLFWPNGSAYTLDWGRPQNDSPAIRAYVLTRWAKILISEGKEYIVREKLYRPELPASTVIKADLEYTSHHLDESCFDLWEEVRGGHFFTRMVQRRALIDGASLAQKLNDREASRYYLAQVETLEKRINDHFDWDKKIIRSTLERNGGIDYKNSNLDASVVLAALQGSKTDTFFSVTDPRLASTVDKLSEVFKSLYPINANGTGVAIGRYPEDRYDGYGLGEANPWVLLTASFAEYYYKLASSYKYQGVIRIGSLNLESYKALLPNKVNKLKVGKVFHKGEPTFDEIVAGLQRLGDSYLKRIYEHTGGDGNLSEQMNRYTGYMQGAFNLTWSNANFITAVWERASSFITQ